MQPSPTHKFRRTTALRLWPIAVIAGAVLIFISSNSGTWFLVALAVVLLFVIALFIASDSIEFIGDNEIVLGTWPKTRLGVNDITKVSYARISGQGGRTLIFNSFIITSTKGSKPYELFHLASSGWSKQRGELFKQFRQFLAKSPAAVDQRAQEILIKLSA